MDFGEDAASHYVLEKRGQINTWQSKGRVSKIFSQNQSIQGAGGTPKIQKLFPVQKIP